tara:strand:- start:686 stop:1081 length:396 start_codon:yes stop_codon:yes gene_type:complete
MVCYGTSHHEDGGSLTPLLSNDPTDYVAREYVFSENVMPEVFSTVHHYEKGKGVFGVRHPDAKMVRSRRWKYNNYPEGYEELFDLESDPGERDNFAPNPEHKDTRDAMKQRLLDWLIRLTETEQIAEKWLV